jgi:hypothetical protein
MVAMLGSASYTGLRASGRWRPKGMGQGMELNPWKIRLSR